MTWAFTSGRPETKCGAGSTIAYTSHIRAWLPRTLVAVGAKIVLDAPCGDFNWMSRTNLSMVDYIGIDEDPKHVVAANMTASDPVEHSPRSKRIVACNILIDRLPICDVVICRDFLQHLPTEHVWMALRNLATTGATWLFATSHDNAVNDDIDNLGEFRPLNMMAPPFNFPLPIRSVEDGRGRILGLWVKEHWR